jgi:urease beta subunit
MQTNAKTILIKSNAAAAQKLRAEPGQAMAIVIDGVPFTGQKHINGKEIGRAHV